MTTESKMKIRGEDRVWKVIKSKTGSKYVPQTQIGQHLIFDDALTSLPKIRNWIDNQSYEGDRMELKEYFLTDDILIQKTVETFLLLAARSVVERKSQKIKSRHKSISTIQKKVFEKLSINLTFKFMEIAVEASQIFKTEKTYIGPADNCRISLTYKCLLSEEISQKLTQIATSAFFPEPMVELPINWKYQNKKITGGYKTYQYEMIRINSGKVNYEKISKKIYEAINYIQSTSWKINKKIVKIVKNDQREPEKKDYIKTDYPDKELAEFNIDIDDPKSNLSQERIQNIKNKRIFFKTELEEYIAESKEYLSAMGKHRAVTLALGIAERYQECEAIYFPHYFDFRGRIYPLPVGLSPQGSDAVKAMLSYTEGSVLTARGEEWAWAYLTSLHGDDKMDFEDRVKKGKQLLHTAYTEAEEPYQFLAHQLELQEFVKNPNYKFNGRIHLDACNSGSQFTSAITGDEAGCKATNVIPTFDQSGKQIRQDAYLLVANKALTLTKKMISENNERKVALEAFEDMLTKNGRKICKKPVMVSNYGGTEGGRSVILGAMMRELKIKKGINTKENAALYSKTIGSSITGVLNGGKAFETYIQKMNGVIASRNKPITWTTSDGFHVVHIKHKELKEKRIRCLLPGARRETVIRLKRYSQDVSPSKMRSAISPNYIHSLDAELLRRVAMKMKLAGVANSDWIHDSFGCHPNHVDCMLHTTIDEFVKLIQRMPLKVLDRQLREQAGKTKPVLKKLSKIKLPINQDFDFNLPLLACSFWFFS